MYQLDVIAGLRAGLNEKRTIYFFKKTGSRTRVDLSILLAVQLRSDQKHYNFLMRIFPHLIHPPPQLL